MSRNLFYFMARLEHYLFILQITFPFLKCAQPALTQAGHIYRYVFTFIWVEVDIGLLRVLGNLGLVECRKK